MSRTIKDTHSELIFISNDIAAEEDVLFEACIGSATNA